MREIAQWLEKLGMSEYAQRFAENDIDLTLLNDLTDQDLKELGVASLGHRRKILRAIAELASAQAPAADAARSTPAAAKPPPIPAAARPSAAAAAPEAAGERRYLTVMFCDLVGSTGIAAQLDAEEWRDLVGSYLDAASAAVTEMGGHVAKKLGDGILALFGYPVAHENDAERAARAALAIQRALADQNRQNAGTGKPELKARIGLDTGPAVVDAAGEIFGDVANVAARVQALAEPDAVVITARVQRQIAGLFVAEERGTHSLKGVTEPTALFKLVRPSGGGRRAGQRQLTPLVGRDDEMTMLVRRWQRARQGEGQLILIVGEPGLGKSRLIEEFHTRLGDTPHTWVEWTCSQLLQNTPLHPLAEWGRSRFGGADVPAERRLADLEASLAQVKLDPAELVPLLAPLLDMPLPKERMPALAGEELRRRQLAALTNWTMAGARTQPLVLAFEDLHWADPTTLDVLRSIAEQGALAPLFILATMRPEFRPPWSMRSHHGTISLAPLDRAQVRDMVGELAARHALSREVIEDVAARTGGVPLFVEEVTRLLLERGEQGGIEAIPPTLQQSLMARLDRLGPAREVAQVGAVIGRGFSYKLLRNVAGMEDAPLQAALEKLTDADILLVQGLPPDSDYRFKHALIQDAAYENLLKSRRQVLHRRVAETLRDRFADTAAAEPEVLAHHFTQAGQTDAAIEWWGKAGDQALRRSAFQEAISHLGKAIEMADKEGEAAPRVGTPPAAPAGQRLKLQTSLGQAMMHARGYTAAETAAAFARARELTTTSEDHSERFATYYGIWVGGYMRGDATVMRDNADAAWTAAEAWHDPAYQCVANRIRGVTTLVVDGDVAGAVRHCQQAAALYDPVRDRESAFRFGQDIGVSANAYLGLALWQSGEPDRARAVMEHMMALALAIGHAATIAYAHYCYAVFEAIRLDAQRAKSRAEACLALAGEHGISHWQLLCPVIGSWAVSKLDGAAKGLPALRDALAACRQQQLRTGVDMFLPHLALAEAEVGQTDQALATVTTALAGLDGGHIWDAEVHRIRGEILLKRDPVNTQPAEEAFLTAIAVAQQQKAKSFELRAALSLAKLYQSAGRAADAHAVLAPALEGFSPTPEFPEIEQAQALLAALAETEEVRNAAAARQRRLHLQTSYGQALLWSKGYAAPETAAAFARAQDLTAGAAATSERFVTYYGQSAAQGWSGDLRAARQIAAYMLRDAGTESQTPEALAAHRLLALVSLSQGNFAEGKTYSEKALKIDDSAWDRDAKLRFGQDSHVSAITYLAYANWLLGDVRAAHDLMGRALAAALETAHVPTLAFTHLCAALFNLFLDDDAEAVRRHADTLVELGDEHQLSFHLASAGIFRGWARARLVDRESGLQELAQALDAYRAQGNKFLVPLFQGLLAEQEAEGQITDVPLTHIDDALALAAETGERWTDALLHRIRGEILLKRDPANTAPAEEAFLTAIAIAQQQKAKSFELRAALSLAKLYQSTSRAADAHAVLTRALEGFSPTPEFPEIEQAQALLAALAETEEVRNAAAARQRRLHLQTSYGQALLWSKGYADKEAKAAFARAEQLASGIEDAAERLKVYYGQCLGNLLRGEFTAAQSLAEGLLRDAERGGRAQETAFARRVLGLTRHMQGALAEAQTLLEQALKGSDGQGEFRVGHDMDVAAKAYLAHTVWVRGDFARARSLIDESVARAASGSDVPDQCVAYSYESVLAIMQNDAEEARGAAERLSAVAQEHGTKLYLMVGRIYASWARAWLDRSSANQNEFQQALADYTAEGNKWVMPFFLGLLAAIQLETQGEKQSAAARIDEALALAQQTGEHWTDAFLHRIRGEILLKRDPANTAPAEDAFLTAIATAQRQEAKAFELHAALALAKLYQSINRAADAHAVLAAALRGFSLTPEFPEIEQAQTLLGALRSRRGVQGEGP